MSPMEIIEALLNPDSIRLGFSIADGESPICLYVNIYKRSSELPESTKFFSRQNHLSLVLGSGHFCVVVVPDQVYQREDDCPVHQHAPLLGESRWMKLTYSLTEAAWISLCLFHLELYFSSTGPQWMQLMTNLGAVEVVGTWVAKF